MNQGDAGAQPQDALTIGDLAQRTGLSPAVLRMWEARHGFPVPRRLESGHRRYAANDVDLVRQVVQRKDAGVRLETAIAEAAAGARPPAIYVDLRRAAPSAPAARGAPAQEAHPGRPLPGHRGRVLRGRRAPGAVRRVPAG